MDISPTSLFQNFLPALPGILITCVLAVLGLTVNSSDQDAVTQMIVAAARPVLGTPAPLGRSQRVWRVVGACSVRVLDLIVAVGLGWVVGCAGIDGVKGEVVHVGGDGGVCRNGSGYGYGGGDGEKTVLGIAEAVRFVFDRLRDPKHGNVTYTPAEVVDVEVEWTERRRRRNLQDHLSDTFPVVLYVHGGAHCLMDPTTHRLITNALSNASDADICAVRFRSSPQHPFPAALIDIFVAYLSLLSPPPGSTRTPIESTRIVFAGDSSGGGLAASLLLLLLTLARENVAVRFHGREVCIPNPPCAGMGLVSAWLDITRSLPSTEKNERWDMIAPPPVDSASPPFPVDEVWPRIPPRAETYCAADICTHPLVSPLAATAEMWVGTPPVWLCSGWEGFTDEMEVFVRRVWMSGEDARVGFEGWEGMPHCFGLMPWNWAGRDAFRQWAEFCAGVVGSSSEKGWRGRKTAGWTATKGRFRGVRREVTFDRLGDGTGGVGYVREFELTDDVVDMLMEKGRDWRIGLEEAMVRLWKEGT